MIPEGFQLLTGAYPARIRCRAKECGWTAELRVEEDLESLVHTATLHREACGKKVFKKHLRPIRRVKNG